VPLVACSVIASITRSNSDTVQQNINYTGCHHVLEK